MKTDWISIEEYGVLCSNADLSPNYSPKFVEFYFDRLSKKPKIVGRFDREGRLFAAYPVLGRMVFPNSLHKKLLGKKAKLLGDIGQPETLLPVLHKRRPLFLGYLSPTTSGLLKGVVNGLAGLSIKKIAIAKETKHRTVLQAEKTFLNKGGKIVFTEELDKQDFIDVYCKLYSERWRYSMKDMCYVRSQIRELYTNVLGGIVFMNQEPMAVQLCYECQGKGLYYVDYISIGVKEKNQKFSYGSIMMLAMLSKARAKARELGKQLRFSFGYYYGEKDYKKLWAAPEELFVGI